MPFNILSEKDFLGRSDELQFLYRLALNAKAGIAPSVFLSGQMGVGKTEVLKQLFNLLFYQQDSISHFYYPVNKALISASDFSEDYIGSFVRQRLAFGKKDSSLLNAEGLSIESLLRLAGKSDALWATDILSSYLQTKPNGNPTNLILSALSAPYRSHISTGTPVIVMIDNFQQVKKLYGFNPEDNKNLWMLFEEPIKSVYTPHVITGLQVELQKMFFQETSLGKSLEIINLPGLDKDVSLKLFSSMCETYNINFEKESWLGFVDLFNGNPFYIRSFIHAASQEGKDISIDELWKVYFSEITKGKFYTYWISVIKAYMPQLDLRKASLQFLYHLYKEGPTTISSNLASIFSINHEELYEIISLFHTAGIVEGDFTTFKLIEDETLIDVIRCLYCKEILKEPLNKIEDVIIEDKLQRIRPAEEPSFELTIPIAPKTELIAVNTLEQIAKNHNIPPQAIGQLQIALIDLFTNVIGQDVTAEGNFHLKFKPKEDSFTLTVQTPQKELVPFGTEEPYKEGDSLELIKRFTDDIKFEKTKKGTNIILRKNLTYKSF